MNYSYRYVNEKPGFEIEKNIVFLTTCKANGESLNLHTEDILASQDLFTALVADGNDFKIAKIDEIAAPVITCDSTQDVTDLYNLVASHLVEHNTNTLGEGMRTAAATSLSAKTGISTELIKEILVAAESQFAYERSEFTGEFNVGVDRIDSDFFKDTKGFFDTIDRKNNSMFTSISEEENKTLFQKKETDELFIKLPDSQVLLNAIENDTLDELMPKFGEVAMPFPKGSAAYTPFYKENSSYIPESEYPLIEGDPKNNSLGIQDNEKTFYDAMNEWCQYCIRQEFGQDIELTDESKVILDRNSQKYLIELANTLYIWYWRHNKNVPSSISVGTDDSDDAEGASSDSVDSKYEYSVKAGEEGNASYINALISLDEFLDRVSIELGYKVYLEAIIKLARWGTRKCTALVFKDYPYTFELGTGSSEDNIGLISDYDLVTLDGGKHKSIEFAFKANNPIMDKKYLLSHDYKQKLLAAPVGVAFTSTLKRRSDNKELKAPVYISMIDLVTEIYANNSFVGITVDSNGHIHCDSDLEVLDDITMDKVIAYIKNKSGRALIDPVAISDSLQNVYISLGVSGRGQNQFSILANVLDDTELQDDIKFSAFKNSNELSTLFDTCQISSYDMAIEFNVADVILPIYIEVSKRVLKGEVKNFEDLLNAFAEEMIRADYCGESGFLENNTGKKFKDTVPQSLSDSVASASSSVEKVDAFGKETQKVETEQTGGTANKDAQEQKEQQPTQSQVTSQSQQNESVYIDKISVIRNVNEGSEFAKIKDSLGNVIGGGAIQKRTIDSPKGKIEVTLITLVDLDYLKTIPDNKFKYLLSARQVYAQILHSFMAVELGRANGIVTYFKDIKTMDYYRKLFSDLANKGLLC